MTTEPVADCECCGRPLHEGDDFEFCPEGIIWTCRDCVEAEEERLRDEFGWIGVWRGKVTGGDDSPSSQDGNSAATSPTHRRPDTGGATGECKSWTPRTTRP